MIPLAKRLQERRNRIFIGSGNELHSFFRSELTGLTFIFFPGFKPRYSRYLPQYIVVLLKTPAFLWHIVNEHFRLKKIITENCIDIVISDNRPGLWNRKVKSVYVTHQTRIPFPESLRFLEWTGVLLHRYFIRKFDYCFIPDLQGEQNLTGRLAHGIRHTANTRFIGILSRFDTMSPTYEKNPGPVYYTLILSGPEPQKSMLRSLVVAAFLKSDLRLVILEGKPGHPEDNLKSGKITSYNHLPAGEMLKIMLQSEGIICRSGYTTIMELISIGCSALLIPTPGQTEQEYLSRYLSGKGWFSVVSQKKLDPGIALPSKKVISFGSLADMSRKELERALDELLNQ